MNKTEYNKQDTLKQLSAIYVDGCGGVGCDDCALDIVDPPECVLVVMMEAIRKARGYGK